MTKSALAPLRSQHAPFACAVTARTGLVARGLRGLGLLALAACGAATQMPSAAPVNGKAATAAAPGSAPLTKVREVEGITEYALPNGLRVLLYPDATKPTVTVNLTFFVGSRYEGYGESGMAHLLEHMLFKGTPRHPDIWKLLQERGAHFNGTTWWDRTNYYEELPASADNLAFAIDLEADRMVNSKIAAEDLAKEFSVVRNEFEMGENDPQAVLEEKMFSAAYEWHNYGKSTIGSRSDIERVPPDALRAFYRKYYQPDNAMLIVAGAFAKDAALGLIGQAFGSIPKPTRPLDHTYTVEPVQDGERTVTLRRNGDIAVSAAMYHTVAGSDPDWLATDALSDILASKPTGRLYKALVGTGLATEVWSTVYPTAEPGVLIVGAKIQAGVAPEKVQDALYKTVEGIATHPIEAAEVQRWRSMSRKQFELILTDTSSVGVALSDWAAMGDFRLFFHARDQLDHVSEADVTRIAKSFVKPSNRTAGLFLPTTATDRAPAVSQPDIAAILRDYKPKEAGAEGEAFVASIDNIEARTERVTLPSGIKLALLPKKTKGGAVRLSATLRWGSLGDVKGKRGAASLLADMLLRGSKQHSFEAIKDELDRLKADVSFDSVTPDRPNVTAFHVLTTGENLNAVIALLGELLREPAFPKTEFEALRKETLAQLEEQRQDPMAKGYRTLQASVAPWPKGDPRHVSTIDELIDDLKQVKLETVAGLHHALFGAGSLQVAVVGDLDAAAVKADLEKAFSNWHSGKPYQRIERPFQAGKPGDEIIDIKDKEMAFVGVAEPVAMKMDDPDYPTMVLFNHILGGSVSSRLLTRLRHKGGLSYSAFSRFTAPPLDSSGTFLAGAICAPQNAARALSAVREEIATILKDGVPEAELADAKKSYASTWETQLANDDFVVGELNQGLFLGRTFAFWKTLNERIQAVTASELLTAARKYIEPAKLASVQSGDLSKSAAH